MVNDRSLELTHFMVSHVVGLRVSLFLQLSASISFIENSRRLVRSLHSLAVHGDSLDVALFAVVALHLAVHISSSSHVDNLRGVLTSRIVNLNLSS